MKKNFYPTLFLTSLVVLFAADQYNTYHTTQKSLRNEKGSQVVSQEDKEETSPSVEEQSPPPSPLTTAPQVVTTNSFDARPVLFTGDVMLGRYVETLSGAKGYQYPFLLLQPVFRGYSRIIANLEGPIPDDHERTPSGGFRFSFSNDAPKALRASGITAVSLANNHTSDLGEKAKRDTDRSLSAVGVAHFGHSLRAENTFYEIPFGSTTMVVFGVNVITPGWDEKEALRVAKEFRDKNPGKVLTLFVHWGVEYRHSVHPYQRELAEKFIDAGVDVIIGSHPHVVEGMEVYKGKPIVYSLGNCVFDQYFSRDTKDGLLVSLTPGASTLTLDLLPITSEHSQPSLADTDNRDRILRVIASSSSAELESKILSGSVEIPW